MHFFSRVVLIALWPTIAFTDQALTSTGPLAYYLVEKAAEPLIIDGRLDDFPWAKAIQINNLNRQPGDHLRIDLPTRAKMLWDDEFFYISFACQDADIWAMYENEDDALWEEEVVEIFIDPDGDGENYLELEVNPLNVVVDLLIYTASPEWTGSLAWDIAGLKTAVQVYGTVNDSLQIDHGWTVEIGIPWTAMADSVSGGHRPSGGDIWRLNLYRIERKGGRKIKARIDALQAQLAPIGAKLATLWQDNEDHDETQLNAASRRQLANLNKQQALLDKELSLLQTHSRQQTEFTSWSKLYRRGFHQPDRFGAVQFVD